jgi:hypothetical protein
MIRLARGSTAHTDITQRRPRMVDANSPNAMNSERCFRKQA